MPEAAAPTCLPRLAALACVLSLAACGGQGLTQTGFLANYEQRRPQPEHTEDAIYVKPGFAASAYKRVIIEPVAWVPSKDSPQRDPETIAMLQASFRDSLAKELSERFTVVEEAAPGQETGADVLRVRSAITNTRRALWWVNVPAQAAQVALGGIGILRPSAGGASEEIEARDAATGETVVAIATYNNGMPWNVVGSYVEYNHARRAFSIASELLNKQLGQDGPAPVTAQAGPQRTILGSLLLPR